MAGNQPEPFALGILRDQHDALVLGQLVPEHREVVTTVRHAGQARVVHRALMLLQIDFALLDPVVIGRRIGTDDKIHGRISEHGDRCAVKAPTV